MKLKETLLSTAVIENNEFLDQYITLINNNKQTQKEKYKHQRHHIIPQSYYKMNKLEIDNSQNNLVYLTHYDHLLAHYLLYKCSIYPFKQHCALSCKYIIGSMQVSIDEIPFLNNDEYNRMIEESIMYTSEKTVGHTMSEDSKRKLSRLARDRMLGSTRSQETRKKISESHRGKKASEAAKAKMSRNHADVSGDKNPAKGRHWFNNGVSRLYLKDSDIVPEGFVRGNLPKSADETAKRKESLKGKNTWGRTFHWFNNGTIETMSSECPAGFKKGRLKKNK